MKVITEIKRTAPKNWKKRLEIAIFFYRCSLNNQYSKGLFFPIGFRMCRIKDKIMFYKETKGRLI